MYILNISCIEFFRYCFPVMCQLSQSAQYDPIKKMYYRPLGVDCGDDTEADRNTVSSHPVVSCHCTARVLYCTVLYSVIVWYGIVHNNELYCTVQYGTVLYIMYCTGMYCIYCTVL